jgi:hypothetical protein
MYTYGSGQFHNYFISSIHGSVCFEYSLFVQDMHLKDNKSPHAAAPGAPPCHAQSVLDSRAHRARHGQANGQANG